MSDKTEKLSYLLEKIIRVITIIIITGISLYTVLPMLVLKEKYIFTIHDGLDSYAGYVKMIHDGGYYFKIDPIMPFLGGIRASYLGMSYNLYDFFNCMFGYLPGQICTRIIGVGVGFFSMHILLNYLYKNESTLQRCLLRIISIIYAVTPCAPNRTISFAFLPLVIYLFLKLMKKEQFTKLSLLAVLIPVVTDFSSILVFVIIIWFVGCIFVWILKRKPNLNLFISFALMSIATIPININFLFVALRRAESNRSLRIYSEPGTEWFHFKDYLLNGQYHAPGMHGYILLPVLLLATVYVFTRYHKYTDDKENTRLKQIILITGWALWLISAFVMAFQEAGYSTGFLLLDGFSWGRMIALTRVGWCLMLGSLATSLPKKGSFPLKRFGIIEGLSLFLIIYMALIFVFRENGFPDVYTFYDEYGIKNIIEILKMISYIAFGGVLFYSQSERIVGGILYSILILHLFYIFIAVNEYDDITYTTRQYVMDYEDVSMEKFFSEELFEDIKKDINYHGEWVAAYGFHPSVLNYNGFHTLDGYASVHTMEYQIKFREIIAPALDRYENWRSYYDGWGGRMYLYGELPYDPWRIKEVEPAPLYINTKAFNELGGKYILSRTPISNADELGISFVRDYDREDSLYHIYLYSTILETTSGDK